MAANIPMAANGHLMIQQQQPQQQPQQTAQQRQLQQIVYQNLASSMQLVQPNSWQSTTQLPDRLGKTINLISNTILAMPTADFQKALSFGLDMERKGFIGSQNRDAYDAFMSQKINEMVKRRQENAPILQNQINADAARQAQLQQQQQQQQQQVQAQQQQMLMNQMAAARGMGQPVQQGFQHLQHPMQVTQIPQQQPQGLNAGMANAAMLQNRPGQPQRFMMGQQRIPGAGMPANIVIPRDMSQLSEADRQKVSEAAQRLYQEASDAQRNQMRQIVAQKLNPAVAAQYTAQGKDPAMLFFQNQAFTNLQKSMQARLMQRQGMPPGVLPPGQHPSQLNPSMMGGLGPQTGVTDAQLFPPANMETIRNEQQIGLMAQQNGQLVVPASMPGRNPTPGPINGLPAQTPANNASILGQTPRSQQVQPGFMPGGRINALAQARAQAPTQNMMGQPGGLGGPPPNSQSPAMNTLTAPMRQPPVAMNPAANQPPMGQNNQHPGAATLNPSFNHQTNARPMQGLPMNNNPAMAQILSAMSAETRASMSNLPPAKVQELMEKWASQARNPLNNNVQGPKPQAQVPNVFGIPGQPQPGPMGNLSQFPIGNNMQQPGVVNQAPNQPTPQQLAARAQLAQLMNNPQARLTMDSLDIPPNVLEHLRGVPQDIRKWGQLRAWLPNSGLAPQMQARLLQTQVQHFSSLQDKKPGVAAPVGAATKPQTQIPGSTPLSNGPMPANTNAPQQPTSLPPLPANIVVPPVTQQEIEVLRRNEPRARALSDEQFLLFARRWKEDQYKKKLWLSQALQDGGKAPGQAQGIPTPQQASASTPVPAPQNGRQPPPQKPAAGPDADSSAPGSATLKNARPPQLNRPAASNPSPATAKQSLKRPNSDDSNDAPQPPSATQRPPSQSVGRLPQMTPEQVANLPPEQRARYEQALRQRAQQLQAMQNPNEDVVLMKKLGQEESAAVANEEHKPVPMSPEEMTELRNKIHWLTRYLTVVQSYIPKWFATTKDEARCRLMFRGRCKMMLQYADGDKKTKFNPYLTISRAEVERYSQVFESIFKELPPAAHAAVAASNISAKPPQPAQTGGETATQLAGQISAQAAPTQAQAPKPAQPNRPAGRSGQPPAAPTSTQPPFVFGAQASPTGTPTYFGKPEVTVNNLKAPPPPRKKVKRDSELPSPSLSQAPGVNCSPQPKVPSPDVKRAPAPEPPKPQPKSFPCPEADCEYYTSGFSTEDARNAHHLEEHKKPREDPLKFFHDCMDLYVAQENDSKSTAGVSGQDAAHAAAIPMNVSLSWQGQTPGSRPESAATPMSRDASMRRQGSAAGGKGPEGMGTPGKNGVSKPGETPKLGKQDFDAPVGVIEDPWANSTIDPQSLFSGFGMDATSSHTLLDMNLYRSSTPNDTPESSKDSGASEPNSDISEGMNLDIDLNWQSTDADVLLDLNNISMEGYDSLDGDLMGDGLQFSLDDMNPDFSKPFQFDASLYSMDPTC